jgi:16S rRNA (cytidine1402-2'-O)-methyltransferase
MDDMSFRAIKILNQVDLIACEDTRVTGKLLFYYKINTKMISYHEHNEDTKLEFIISEIFTGKSVALVSDAGTPLVSDPGFPLVRRCREEKIDVIALPGANAFVTALVASGFPSHKFKFLGFVPSTKGRAKFISSIMEEDCTLAMYQSPMKMKSFLKDLNKAKEFDFRICLARELTKVYEEYIFDTIENIQSRLNDLTYKGEFVVLIDMNRK